MKLAIMQPYFFPYIGYFQLISAVDLFIVYDNIQYTKKGWINRNRILQNGTDALISLPIKKASDFLDVCDREVAESFNRKRLLNKIRAAYNRAPYFKQTFPLVEAIVKYDDANLFRFIYHSMSRMLEHLGVSTQLIKSSDVNIDHTLKGQDKVLALCDGVSAETYINAIGGIELYSKEAFSSRGIELKFIKSHPIEYRQFKNEFCPWLSIIDVMMFNSIDMVREYLNGYELI